MELSEPASGGEATVETYGSPLRAVPPTPPTCKSCDADGRLKDTRASGSHKASYPENPVRIPVHLTTPSAGIVLDPFIGRGTTMVFAKSRGLRSIGMDLNVGYCQQTVDALASITDRS